MKSPSILIVEDEAIAAMDIKSRLGSLGYSTTATASTGDEALKLVEKTDPDLVLIDIELAGGMDGIETARQINLRYHLPVVFLTANSDDTTLFRVKETNPFGYILKPFEDRELRSTIELAIYKHTAEEEIGRLTRLYATLSQVNQAVVRTQSREELLQEVCRVSVEFGGFRMVWIGWIDPATSRVEPIARFGDKHGYLDQIEVFSDDRPKGRGPIGVALRENKPLIVNDFQKDPLTAPWHEPGHRSGFHGMAAFPIRVAGLVQGALAIYAGERYFFREKEVSLLAEIAADISFALDKLEEETRRKQAEKRLKDNEEHYRMLYDEAPMAYQSLDVNGCFLEVNQAWLTTMGYTREEVIGQWFGDFLVSDSNDLFRQRFPRFKSSGEVHGAEFDMQRKDGTTITVVFNGRVGYTPIGTFKQTHCVLRDISEVRRAEKALKDSNQFYHQIIASARDGIVVYDLDLRYLVWNAAMEQFSGTPAAIVLGRHCWEVFPFLRDVGVVEALRAAIARKPAVILDFQFDAASGTRKWASHTSSPLRDAAGEVVGVIAVVRDITERKQVEENLQKSNSQLRESEERYRRLVELSPDAVIIHVDNNVVFINSAGLKLFGASHSDQILGKNILELVHPDFRSSVVDRITLLQREHATAPLIEQKYLRIDGTVVEVEVMGAAFTFSNQKAVLVIARDITSRKMMEVRFLRDQRIETIGALASGIAHDLNNVLAPIVMTVALLRDKCNDADTLALIGAMETSAHRGAGIIQQLLTFGRGAGGQRALVKPKHLLKEIADLARETFPKSIEVKLNYRNTDWLVLGDATQLHQVLLNLCVNARDAMPGGGKLMLSLDMLHLDASHPEIIGDAKPGPYVVLTVQDTGKGVQPEISERIFEPFFTTKELGKGTGLGLATCLNLVKRHGGFIELTNEPGSGARFRVFLPATAPAVTPDAALRPAKHPSGNGQLILVVDDEDSIRKITRTALEKHGYQVLTANDGLQAISVFQENQTRIHAVLMDIMMPVMGGPAAMRKMYAIDPSVVLIATSGMVPKELEGELADLKPRGFLAKPFTTGELLDLIASVLSKSNE